jgi:hypothetical protein
VSGDAGRLPGSEPDQAERAVRELGAGGQVAVQRAPAHAAAAGTASASQAPAGHEVGDDDDLGLFGLDRPEPEVITAAEQAAVTAWAYGQAEWPPSDPLVRSGLHNLASDMAEEIGWRPDEMVQVRAGDLDNVLLVAVSALYEVDRQMEAAQQPAQQADWDQDGRGMRWLEPGQAYSLGTERSSAHCHSRPE